MKRNRALRILLGLLLCAVFALALALPALAHDHDCDGAHCAVCAALVHICKLLLPSLAAAAALCTGCASARPAACMGEPAACQKNVLTPVALKVKLVN